MTHAIQCRGVTRGFHRTEVLRELDLDVKPGTFVALAGKNGAGKSTLFKTLLGLLKPDYGRVRVLDMDPFQQPIELRRRIGYAAEQPIFPETASVDQLLDLHRSLYPTWDREYEDELIDRFAIPRYTDFGKLSKGVAQQASLVFALAHRPELLLLDEPSAGLDPSARREFLKMYVDLIAAPPPRPTIFLSTHRMEDAERVADEVAILHGGRIVLHAAKDALREEFTLVVVAASEAKRFDEVPMAVSRHVENDSVRFVVHARPEECAAVFGPAVIECRTLVLDDLFVEVVGGLV